MRPGQSPVEPRLAVYFFEFFQQPVVLLVLAGSHDLLLHPLEVFLQAGLGLGRKPGVSYGVEDVIFLVDVLGQKDGIVAGVFGKLEARLLITG